jgi:hypothetical protein
MIEVIELARGSPKHLFLGHAMPDSARVSRTCHGVSASIVRDSRCLRMGGGLRRSGRAAPVWGSAQLYRADLEFRRASESLAGDPELGCRGLPACRAASS